MWVNVRGDRGDQPLPKLCLRACRIQHLLIILRLTFRVLKILLISGILKNRVDGLPVREEVCMSRVFGVFLPGLPRDLELSALRPVCH
jgi:hypothetical protein